ncbi:MAG: hypothetical protein MPW14_21465 [Candidatus Manganitrophus sp.]|nr:MAG: hypothetical protein MPW14_21465 [Candidatus Manganitrophus sp.]
MATRQRYVSSEMTHFVGRDLAEADQYKLLIQIITSGWLTHPPHDPAISGRLTVNTDARISENEMYYPQIISFSDIPIGEFDIHIQKFSRFGLSFFKFVPGEAGRPIRFSTLPKMHARATRGEPIGLPWPSASTKPSSNTMLFLRNCATPPRNPILPTR